MFKKILVAIDDGAPAARALDVGIELAMQLNGRIGALHVIDPSRAFHSEPQVLDEAILIQLRQDAERVLAHAAARASAKLEVERLLAEGDPAETILEFARDWGADLIVIGTDSRGRLAHFLLGSTADAVIRRASCPVMAVRVNAVTGKPLTGRQIDRDLKSDLAFFSPVIREVVMQHKPTIELARLAVRSRICPICYMRPKNSETLGPRVARSCEPDCTIFLSLEKMLDAMSSGPIPAAPDDVMRQFVCPSCQVSATAGDYCSDGMTRTCPLSRHGGAVLQLLEDLSAMPRSVQGSEQ